MEPRAFAPNVIVADKKMLAEQKPRPVAHFDNVENANCRLF